MDETWTATTKGDATDIPYENSYAASAVVATISQDKNCVRTEDQCAVNGALSNTCTHVLGRGTVNFFLCNMEKTIKGFY